MAARDFRVRRGFSVPSTHNHAKTIKIRKRNVEHQQREAVLDDQAEISALRSSYESLTPREQEVMRLVVAGMLNKQIGLKLGISEITVKAHRGKMMLKMKADSVADLVKTAVRLGITPAKNRWHNGSGRLTSLSGKTLQVQKFQMRFKPIS